jgi:hypothetical protein
MTRPKETLGVITMGIKQRIESKLLSIVLWSFDRISRTSLRLLARSGFS